MIRIPFSTSGVGLTMMVPASAFLVLGCSLGGDAQDSALSDTTGNAASAAHVESAMASASAGEEFQLPEPRLDSAVSLETAIQNRRSIRDYDSSALSLDEVGQLLWATQGVTSETGARASPSAGGTYPLEVYVVVGRVEGLPSGIYAYLPLDHKVSAVAGGDVLAALEEACLNQQWVEDAAVDVVITADYSRTTERYGERGIRYVHMEAGHAAQNLCLQATALGLGAVTVGAFYDKEVAQIVGLPATQETLYVIPVGRPSS